MKRTFYVEAIWNEEHKVWTSKSDIKGLVIETKTLQEFEEVVDNIAIELIIANHLRKPPVEKPLEEWLPFVKLNMPVDHAFA